MKVHEKAKIMGTLRLRDYRAMMFQKLSGRGEIKGRRKSQVHESINSEY